ncbi:GspE/PulE family protein [Klebsiella aerogenes]|uniref:GspE/PulE family protein n=2 Tax=Klebsiella TaxID=570 RepID=UPI0007BE7C50|nr:GspE/PulE family protein [Klebsiella aerogenes]EKZ5855722.1 type II/IV secretion system protein [Klebsiella aerogenes]EKZ6548483.1 type II/IV secretion system protein [Klebsiella aerogenes]EKZ6676760.1 type II/IV secretion system protein [Klebsiella aerogenes]KZR11299.1 hypothetical protein A3N65_12445 [Klebsiella aerogenes]
MSDVTLPKEFVQRHGILVKTDGILTGVQPPVAEIMQRLYRYTGIWYQFSRCTEAEYTQLYQLHYGEVPGEFGTLDLNTDIRSAFLELPPDTRDFIQDDDAPVIRLINSILHGAVKQGASDVHVESFKKNFTIRFRIDGMLYEVTSGDSRLASPFISRLKIMANLDIAERRLPQDGRILWECGEQEVDIRVSVIPVAAGERVVLRILNQKSMKINLSSVGLPAELRARIEKLLMLPHGMILLTGPTGSGKSTSLYAFLQHISVPEKNIMTIEDPVEYQLSGIGQTQVNTKIGMTFARGLRSLLRQDPDVVMIGEIRDDETAGIAIQAALTGHMVFSTLHTNTAIGAISRLRDMNVEPYLIASALSGVIAQRLIRCLCPHCKRQCLSTPEQMALLQLSHPVLLYEAQGCEQCHNKGYSGRTGIYEFMPVDDVVRDMIYEKAPDVSIHEYLNKKEEKSLFRHGVEKVVEGVTNVAELMRVMRAYE